MSSKTVVVTGAGGFIGGHLVADLLEQGADVRGVDVKPFEEWHQVFDDADNHQLDLHLRDSCEEALEGAGDVYNLAADMGGMGFIENNKAACMLSVLINTHLLQASRGGRGRPLLLRIVSLRVRGRQTAPAGGHGRSRRRTPTRLARRTATAGRSSSASACAVTSPRTSASTPGSPGSTTSMGRSAPTTAAARRRRRRSAARSPRPR